MPATFALALSTATRGGSLYRGSTSAVAAARLRPLVQQQIRRALHKGSSTTGGQGRRKRSWLSTASLQAPASASAFSKHAGASEKLTKDASSSSSNASSAAAASSSSSLSSSVTQKLGLPPINLTKDHALFLIGNASYLCVISGFLMSDMLSLRIALGVGYAGLVTYHSLRTNPLRIPQIWSGVFALINVGAVYMLFADELQLPGSVQLTEEEERLHSKHFPSLKKANYRRLMELGNRVTLEDGFVLTREGQPCEKLYFMESGVVNMTYRKGMGTTVLEKGTFVNDVAFQQGEGAEAYGTVTVPSDTKATAIVWEAADLRALLKSKPDMDRNVKVCLTEHLMYALMRQRDEATFSHASMTDEDKVGMEEDTRQFMKQWRYDAAPEAHAEAWVM